MTEPRDEEELDIEPEPELEVEEELEVEPEPEPVQHGVNCFKVNHVGLTGFLHGADDDRPYDVDGVRYCGRCHVALPPPGPTARTAPGNAPSHPAAVKMTQAEALDDTTTRSAGGFVALGQVVKEQGKKPVETALVTQANTLLVQAKALKVIDGESFTTAGQMITQVTAQIRRIEEFFQDDVDRAHATWKGLTTKRANYVTPLKEILATLNFNYSEFAREAKKRAEAEKREREEKARKAEQDRLRREAEEREREAKKLEAEALAARSRDEAAIIEAKAEELHAEAEDLKVEAANVPTPVLQLESEARVEKGGPIPKGNWSWELTSLPHLILAVADWIRGDKTRGVTPEALLPNEPYINKRVKADKDKTNIPGVRAYDKGSVAVPREKR